MNLNMHLDGWNLVTKYDYQKYEVNIRNNSKGPFDSNHIYLQLCNTFLANYFTAENFGSFLFEMNVYYKRIWYTWKLLVEVFHVPCCNKWNDRMEELDDLNFDEELKIKRYIQIPRSVPFSTVIYPPNSGSLHFTYLELIYGDL